MWNPAEKRRPYSGTAIWSRSPIEVLETGTVGRPAIKIERKSRVIVARTGGVVVGCLYLPSGSSSEARQKVKDRMLEEFTAWAEPGVASLGRRTRSNQTNLRKRTKKTEPVCLAGDFNVAPTERDIFTTPAAWKSNVGPKDEWTGKIPSPRRRGSSPAKSHFDHALGSPTCCNAGGTTRCVIKQVNATALRSMSPGGRRTKHKRSRDKASAGTCFHHGSGMANRSRTVALLNDAAKLRCSRPNVHREHSLGVSDHQPRSLARAIGLTWLFVTNRS